MARLGSTTTKRAREMRGVLARWRRSGLTQRVFAAREGIAVSTITWWAYVFRHAARPAMSTGQRKRRRPSRRQPAGPAFLEVKMSTAAPPQTSPLEILMRSGHVIRVPSHFDAAGLRAVMAALESPC